MSKNLLKSQILQIDSVSSNIAYAEIRKATRNSLETFAKMIEKIAMPEEDEQILIPRIFIMGNY